VRAHPACQPADNRTEPVANRCQPYQYQHHSVTHTENKKTTCQGGFFVSAAKIRPIYKASQANLPLLIHIKKIINKVIIFKGNHTKSRLAQPLNHCKK